MASSPSPELPPHSENVEEEISRVCLALEAVFSPADHGNTSKDWWDRRQLADRYLTSFQSTSISWMVCDRLLQRDGSGIPSIVVPSLAIQQQRRFFAAQTLLTKCRSDVYQLPVASLPSLRDSLMDHLTRYSQMSESALTTRLAMCVSALAVQMGWTTIVTDLLGALLNANHANNNNNNSSSSNNAVALLLLRALPEECASDRLLLEDENIRYQMRDHFISNSPLVFQFFLSVLTDHNKQTRVYEAFHNWIRYVPVLPSAVAETPLLDSVVQAMVSQPDSLEIGADILVEIFRMYPSYHEANEVLVHRMVPLVISRLSLDQALSPASDVDEDVQRAYCRIVTEMGESYMNFILSPNYSQASQFVEWVLRCSTIAETEVASITLPFWYRLVIDLEQVEPMEMRQDLVDNYAPYLLRLIDACCTHLLRYPSNLDDLSDDRVDDIHRDRFNVAETVEDCCRLLGGHVVLERMGCKLREECQRVAERQQQNQQTEWQGIEACLFGIQCIHRFTARDEADFLPSCFSLIPQLPPDILPLRVTANMMIGKYAAWLASHPDILPGIWPYLAQGLSIRQCATAAAMAIKELCEFSNQQFSLQDPVSQLYQEIVNNPGRVELKDELAIVEGLCKTLSRNMLQQAPESGHTLLAQVVQPIGDRLAAHLADPSANSRPIIADIERFIVVMRFLLVLAPSEASQQPHPKVSLMLSIWPLLEGATQKYPHDVNLAEKICRLHKHSLRSIGTAHYAPMLDRLIEHLVRNFDRSHLSPYLYAGSICVTEYGRNPAHSERLFEMIQAFSITAFSFLRGLEDLVQYPDVVEEFFYLMGRVIVNCPGPLVATTPLLISLLQCATVGLQLDHRDANRGTLNFIENAVSYGLALREQNQPEAKASMERAFQSEGQGIVKNLSRALVGELPTYSIDEGQGSIAGVLWKLNVWCPTWVTTWMSTALNENGDASTERARLEFLGALDSPLAQSEFGLSVRAFMSACDRHRRYRRGNRRQ